MFEKIVSQLSLTPQALSEMAFYARRLKQESVTRTFSAIAAVLIVVLQVLTIAAPPTPVNASSSNDIYRGGFVSQADLLNRYDESAQLRALYTDYFGISRSDLAGAKTTSINSSDRSLHSIGRVQHTATDTPISAAGGTFFGRPLHIWDTGANVTRGSNYQVIEGYTSRDRTYWAIILRCGNVVYKSLPPLPTPQPSITPVPPPIITPSPVPLPTATPQPTPKAPTPSPTPKISLTCVKLTGSINAGITPLGVTFTGEGSAQNQAITAYNFDFGDGTSISTATPVTQHIYNQPGTWVAKLTIRGTNGAITAPTSSCSYTVSAANPPAAFIKSKTAQNLTQNRDATAAPAGGGDQIKYSLTTKNTGGTRANYGVVEHLEDVLEYATLTDAGGASLKDGVLSWQDTIIEPGATKVQTFVVTIKQPIPATPVGVSDKFSYDLRLDNIYGNQVTIVVAPPITKQVESASISLPDTGAATSTLIVLLISFVTLFFYFRNRQLMNEIHILRGTYQGSVL